MPRSNRRRSHGTVYFKNHSWSVAWREGNERRYLHGHESEDLAERVLATIVANLQAGRASVPVEKAPAATLGELATDWLERRKNTHRAARDDENRWNKHLAPAFGRFRPSEVDAAAIRKFIEHKLTPKVNPKTKEEETLQPNTIGNAVRLLSTFYTDLVERGLAPSNPVAALPRSVRRLYKPAKKDVPYLKSLDDVRRVFLALSEPVNVAFAIGALAGLRTGEVLALEWKHVDLVGRRIHIEQQVRHGKPGPTKDSDHRSVPLLDALAPILTAWKLKTGGEGQLFRPAVATRGGRPGRGSPPRFLQIHTLHDHFKKALAACKLSGLTWYEGTRHTFASQWVDHGGTIEDLKHILGHESVMTTERYSHKQRGVYKDADLARLTVDLSAPAGKVVALDGIGCTVVATSDKAKIEKTKERA